MTVFVQRAEGEPLAIHLNRNADALGLDKDQRARLRRAAALTMGGREDRIEAGILAAGVRNEIRAHLDSVVAGVVARDETIVPHRDALRIKERDGLWSLSEVGSLSVVQVETGLACRTLFELAEAGAVGSQLRAAGEVAAPSSFGDPCAKGLARAYAGVRLRDVHAHIQIRVGTMAVRLLEGVACEGRTIRSLVSGGRAHGKAVVQLRAALDIALERLMATGELKLTARSSADLQRRFERLVR